MVLEQVDLLIEAGCDAIVLLDGDSDWSSDPTSTEALRGIDVIILVRYARLRTDLHPLLLGDPVTSVLIHPASLRHLPPTDWLGRIHGKRAGRCL